MLNVLWKDGHCALTALMQIYIHHTINKTGPTKHLKFTGQLGKCLWTPIKFFGVHVRMHSSQYLWFHLRTCFSPHLHAWQTAFPQKLVRFSISEALTSHWEIHSRTAIYSEMSHIMQSWQREDLMWCLLFACNKTTNTLCRCT